MVTTPLPATDAELTRQLRLTGPMNRERALQVMEQFDLEGLVLGEPLNVYHALGYWPQIANTKVGQPPSTFVLLSRRRDAIPGFVTTRFIHYYTFADGRFERELDTWLYDDTADAGDEIAVPEMPLFPDQGLAPLTDVEQRRRRVYESVPAEHRSMRDAGGALAKAMRSLGLWHGRVGFDHPVVAAVCERHGNPATLVPADNIVRAIRLIKSPLEIALMRRSSMANVAAVHAMIASIRAGAGYLDLRHEYDVEAAQRGLRTVFLNVDRVSSELSGDVIRNGQSLFVDGVSHFRHYHGDYARTVFVGEPDAAAKRAAAAMSIGWQAIREKLKPGLRYSEIMRIGAEAVKKSGHPVTVGFGPHSCGLMHTDEPCEDAGGFYRKADLVLQENMILSVDCPVLVTGVGGSAHMEDLMLITATGAEPIHPVADAVVVV